MKNLLFRRSSIALALTVTLGTAVSFLLPKHNPAIACGPPICAVPDLPVEKGPKAQIPMPVAEALKK